jgi:hypothetical protein
MKTKITETFMHYFVKNISKKIISARYTTFDT